MTNDKTAPSINADLQPRKVETPNLSYSFYDEGDADMTTPQGRLEWFCKHFEVDPPNLKYDEDEPDQILMTDELLLWIQVEGVSLDWIVLGHIAGPLATFREKYRTTPEKLKLIEAMRHLSEAEQTVLVDAIKRGNEPGADVLAEIQKAGNLIKAARKQN